MGVFEAILTDLRELIRKGEGRLVPPSAVILDSRTLQSMPKVMPSRWDGAKRRQGSKVHLAVDMVGPLLALHVTPTNDQDPAQVVELARTVQDATGETVTVAHVDQVYIGESAQRATAELGIASECINLPDVTRGFVLLR